MIFKVVVDSVLHNLVYMVTVTEGVSNPVTERFVQYIQWLAAYFILIV